jgi:hypothetical protein
MQSARTSLDRPTENDGQSARVDSDSVAASVRRAFISSTLAAPPERY